MTTNRTKIKRVPKRGQYDQETIHQILDKEFVCHVGFIHESYPVVIPTLYGRYHNHLYLHGSMASRMMKALSTGIDVCLTVTRVNGLVLARSAFHHSANYESVVLFGKAIAVTDADEKLRGLQLVSEHIIPGRWQEVRQPNAKELKATMLLKIPIDEASAKVRTGGPVDDKEDYDLNIWAGEITMARGYDQIITDTELKNEMDIPSSVLSLIRTQ